MSDLKNEIKKLQDTIFVMLNYANIYVLMLDEKMVVQFLNNSLAFDLGYQSYQEVTGKCWLDFLEDTARKPIALIHSMIADGKEGWNKYQEFQNYIKGKNDKSIYVHWFNSHVNSSYNWTFSFGVRKDPPVQVSKESVRKYWQDVIAQDRTMINTMKDRILFKNRIIDSCEADLDFETGL